MSILTKKLLRNLTSKKGQFFAVATVVAIGIMVYVGMSVSYQNLRSSQEDFYNKNHFADYYIHVVKAPDRIVKQIEKIAGINKVTGRIMTDLTIVKSNGEKATARVITYDTNDEDSLNTIHMMAGRIFSSNSPSGEIEAVVDPQFMTANKLTPGDTFDLVNEGRQFNVKVVGAATGPEFIYVVKDAAAMFPEPLNFGIFILPARQAQQVLNMSGEINQLLIDFEPGVNEKQTVEEIETILKPYGVLASYPRDEQISHAMLEAELDGLRSVINVLPVIFLLIAAAIQFVILKRMIKTQSLQIGIMKAIGYNNWEIKFHYIIYSVLIGLTGVIAGSGLGLLLSGYMTDTYSLYFNLPQKLAGYNWGVIGNAFLLSITVSVLAGLSAANAVTVINPAESMRPESPKTGSRSLIESQRFIRPLLSPKWKMSLRSIHRNRGRFLLSFFGVLVAIVLIMMALGTNDSVNYMISRYFDLDRKYDLQANFSAPVKSADLLEISRLDGVLEVEGLFELPAKIHFQGRSENELLTAYPADLSLKILFDDNSKLIKVPETGILINKNTAAKLGVKPGQEVTVETLLPMGATHLEKVKIAGISTQMFGGGSYINIEEANRIIKEANLVTGAMIKIEPGKEQLIEKEISQMTQVSSILNREKERQNILSMMGTTIFAVAIMIIFALILGFAVIYNSSVISFNEREKELAVLKVLGFTSGEVSGMLLKENILQCLLGIIIGLPAGGILTKMYISALSNDLYDMPTVVYPLSYLISAMGAAVFIFTAHRFAIRGIEKLDLVSVLKNQD
ncbi:MAG: FtsX-like permease family protein [Syntrophomonadaceae bacterium]|nr:FtsX-like permease family protein [Syntrophomonadaceae bacterium]